LIISGLAKKSMMSQSEFDNIKDKIFPVIKVLSGIDETLKESIALDKEDRPVYAELIGDLICLYGIDKGAYHTIILESMLPEGIDAEKVDAYAMENLEKLLENDIEAIKLDWGGIGISCGGNYEAATYLIPWVWGHVMKELGEDIAYAIPAKDLVFFIKGNDGAQIEELKKIIQETHADGKNLLSKKIFRFSEKNGIEILME
jgi:uncharacterized protein YtpQ (UPF0354 family)